ncbi:VOC family protein [Gemmobacter denitrificans]|uniref:Glyoxalase n=1 Tax=Gemmobacter denitrificans TaxID=3123040 RepID=A0ABU8BWG3_9RHOB
MDYDTVPARDFGHALQGLGINLLCRDVLREVAFLTEVLGMKAHRSSRDFAIIVYAGRPFQLHADGTYARHPLADLVPENPPRGGGVELRAFETDPDEAAARAALHPDTVILQAPTDKPGHGLRECVILSPEGYAWVASRRIQPA